MTDDSDPVLSAERSQSEQPECDASVSERRVETPSLLACVAAEFFGTLVLVYVPCAAMLSTAGNSSDVPLAFGLTVMAVIFAVGPISGAHINPAVTFGFAVNGSFGWRRVPGYVVAQFGGALLGFALLMLTFAPREAEFYAPRYAPPSLAANAGEVIGSRTGTFPSTAVGESTDSRAFWAEVAHTFVLMLVIFRVAHEAKAEGTQAGLAIGGTVAALAAAGGASGASMNPARTVWCNLAAGRAETLPIYLIAPLLGAALAAPAHRLITRKLAGSGDVAVQPADRVRDRPAEATTTEARRPSEPSG